MKKTIKVYAVMALVTVLFSGCITATILMSNASKKEKEKILAGEVFGIPNGTITYTDGSTLSFKRYGSYIRFDDYDGDCVIITPSKVYQCDHVHKTYAFDSNKDGKYCGSQQGVPKCGFLHTLSLVIHVSCVPFLRNARQRYEISGQKSVKR